MTEINETDDKLHWLYKIGLLVILALPILTIPPYFFPADWGKSILFRSILAILLFLLSFRLLFKKNELKMPEIKKNIVFWLLAGLFIVFLLATVFSVDPLFSLWSSPYRGGGFVTFSFCLVFAILAFALLNKKDWKKAWIFSIFIGVLVSFVAIIQYFGFFSKIISSASYRPPSTMGNPVILATYILLLIFLALSFAIKEKNRYLKTFYISSVFIFLYTILITESRAVYLGLAFGALYFILLYPAGSNPKKIKITKIIIVALLVLAATAGVYVNTINKYPQFLQQNKLFTSLAQRLSFNSIIQDPRFAAWQIEWNIIKDRPLLGYGPENFSVGFDKYYDPAIPYLNTDIGWWDRAHNILIQTASDAGLPGLIIYLALFVVLFWQLQKKKHAEENSGFTLIPRAIQATLIGYLITNLFSFDSFGIYLIFFLLVGYSMHLIYNTRGVREESPTQKKTLWKPGIVFVLFLVLIAFLWQYNIIPFQINAQINKADDLASRKYCSPAFNLMNKVLPERSFLDSYARMEYVEFTKTCNDYFPENNLAYVENGLALIKEAVKIQPLYTRYWILLGNYTATLAAQEKDSAIKNVILAQAKNYFDRAVQLSPKHQETLAGLARMEIISGNYQKAKDYSEICLSLSPVFGGCYWYLAISEIYLKDVATAEGNIEQANKKAYAIDSRASLGELSDAYGAISDYQNLVTVYLKFIDINPNIAQYHSSLAFFYKELGQYGNARKEALKVLQLSPESKPNVDAFLQTLP